MKIDVKQFQYQRAIPGSQLNLQFGLIQDGNYSNTLREYRSMLSEAMADLDSELAKLGSN
jgi:hypothetical protein